MNMSLDDFIRLKKGTKNNNSRKNDKEEIDKDDLDAELDQITGKTPINSFKNEKSNRSSLSKFDRINMANDSDEDENDDNNDVIMSTQNSSIEFAKEIEKMDHPNCCNFKPFRTIEDKTRVKIKSQQWRLGSDRNQQGKGINNENSSGVRNGRVGKSNRNGSNTDFVRGNFTYGSAGIVRNNRRQINNDGPPEDGTPQIILRKNVHAPGLNRKVQVNIDVTDLYRASQMRNIAPLLAPRPEFSPMQKESLPGSAQLRMAIETDDLMAFLQAKKQREQQAVINVPGNGFIDTAMMMDASNFL